MRVIAEKPTDEAAVALFQDWLLERGEPRGEFLALQRATRPLTPKESKHLAALQKKHEKQWLGSFGPGALKGSARFRSGLPRAVRVSAWKPSDVPKTDDPVLPLLESFWLEGGTNLPLAGVFDGPWRSLAELTAPEFVLAETNQAVLDALVSLGIVRSAGDLEDAERFEVLRRLGSKKLRHLALREQWWSGATELALMKKELGRLESLTVETNDLEAWLALAGVVRELVIAPSEDAHDAASRPRLRVRGGSLTVTLPAVLDEPKHVEDAVALLKQLPAKLRKGAAIESATTPPKVISALIR